MATLQRQAEDEDETVQQPGAQQWRDGVQGAAAGVHRLLLNAKVNICKDSPAIIYQDFLLLFALKLLK